MTNNAPAFQSRQFDCPHCHELHEQVWFCTYAEQINNAEGVPLRIAGDDLQRLSQNPQYPPEVREQKVEYWNRVNSGQVFLERWAPVHTDVFVAGMELSVCRSCLGTAIWLGGRMIYPESAA